MGNLNDDELDCVDRHVDVDIVATLEHHGTQMLVGICPATSLACICIRIVGFLFHM